MTQKDRFTNTFSFRPYFITPANTLVYVIVHFSFYSPGSEYITVKRINLVKNSRKVQNLLYVVGNYFMRHLHVALPQ